MVRRQRPGHRLHILLDLVEPHHMDQPDCRV
jgi:hypothetical protein